jgi:16S rRNA pseudouridine516 synthase
MLLREYLQSVYSISRRKFTDLIDQGKISVNGEVVHSYKQLIQENEELRIKNEELKYFIDEKVKITRKESESIIVLFNKPMGYVVSKADPHNTTIYELLPPEYQGFYYIGRLDKDSRGLLLLTNDPKLVNEYEHPKFEISKEYIVQIDRPLTSRDIQRMKDGLVDEDDRLQVADCRLQKDCVVNIILHE